MNGNDANGTTGRNVTSGIVFEHHPLRGPLRG